MRLALLFGLAAGIALWLQTGLLHWLPLGALVPDLVVILVVDLGLRHHSAVGAVLAFAMGYATDACSGAQLGTNAFMLTLIFLLSYEFSRHMWMTGRILSLFAVLVAAILNPLGVLAMEGGLAGGLSTRTPLLRAIVLQAALTTLVAPLIFAVLDSAANVLRLPIHAAKE